MKKPFLTSKCTLFKTYLWKRENKWCFDTKNGEHVTFEDILLKPIEGQVSLVDEIRSLPYKSEEQCELKRRVWAITPSSIQVGGRGEKFHTTHSGFISFDLDNLGQSLLPALEKIKQIPFVSYCGRSVSGNGLWGLMPISNTDSHSKHFDAMQAAFMAIGIPIDPAPRNVASLRFVCYDPEAYINENASTFTKILEPVAQAKNTLKANKYNPTNGDVWSNFRKNVDFDSINDILTNVGWQYHSTHGNRVRYTRPGKSSSAGVSADYHTDKRTFFIWSSEAPGLEHFKSISNGWAGSAATVLLAYAAHGDKKEAYKLMKQLNY